MNPFSTAAVFLAITARLSEPDRRRQATLACLYALGVLIAVTIGMAAGAESSADLLAIAAGIALVVGISWGILRGARGVQRLLGEQGIDALTRIMGFLLVCIGVQFIGLALTDEAFLGAIQRTLEALEAGR